MPSELARRAPAAVVLILLTLGGAWAGGPAFTALVALAAGIVVVEWTRMTGRGAPGVAIVAVGAIVAAMAAFELFGPAAGLVAVFAGAVAAAVAARARAGAPGWAVAGLLYTGPAAVALVSLRADDSHGFAVIVWLFATVWTGDCAAFLAGSLIGGPRLAPRLSPAKTWAGAVGAVVGAVAVGLVSAAVLGDTSPLMLALMSGGVGIAGILGDLCESGLKRRFGVKNAGDLIPGHGGMMDRVDSLIAAALLAAAVGLIRGGPGALAEGALIW